MHNPLFTYDGYFHILRWIHFMAGIVWIGHLYYFNFCQTPFFAEADGAVKSACVRSLVPRALWWFRWGAAATFLSGLGMLHMESMRSGMGIFSTSWGVWILVGSLLATLMAANVWFIIWPNQKMIIASAQTVAAGGQADPRVADAGARAAVASRTNVLFSIPMLFLMGACRHLPLIIPEAPNFSLIAIVIGLLILAIQLNAIFGKMVAPIKSIPAVVHSGLALTFVLYFIIIGLI